VSERKRSKVVVAQMVALLALSASAAAQPRCRITQPTASVSIPHRSAPANFDAEPGSSVWSRAASTWISWDCSKQLDYPKLKTEVRIFWTDENVYFLFICPYSELNLFLPADNKHARSHLWDRDVVELFLGYDWENIRHYREFEIAPTGDWIDLDIDLDRDFHDEDWRSGWTTAARIDPRKHVWYAAARIPIKSIGGPAVSAGSKWRMNLYRTDGLGADPVRHFMCWQPTCALDRDPNHVPENFGTLVFAP